MRAALSSCPHASLSLLFFFFFVLNKLLAGHLHIRRLKPHVHTLSQLPSDNQINQFKSLTEKKNTLLPQHYITIPQQMPSNCPLKTECRDITVTENRWQRNLHYCTASALVTSQKEAGQPGSCGDGSTVVRY